jgi:DNA-binding transcriptional ArsR family regulator
MAATAAIKVLGEPRRRQILDALRDAGLVAVHPDAQRRLYRLCPAPSSASPSNGNHSC